METHLSTLSATLSSIASLHASTVHAKPSYQPFTSAILNSYHLDIVDYIRDADALEARLFWYPPVGGSVGAAGESSSAAGPSSASTRDEVRSRKPRGSDAEAGAAGASAASLQPRVPEPRQFVPPTPLRKGNEAGAPSARAASTNRGSGAAGYDARTLLVAAQKLCENYHNAPRARKHVKALLKRSQELTALQSRCNEQISELEREVARLSSLPAPASAKGASSNAGAAAAAAAASAAGKAKAESENAEMASKLKKVEEKKQREEMEIVALESMIEELEARRKAVAKKAAQAKASVAQAAVVASNGADETAAQPSSDDTTTAGAADETGLTDGDGADDATVRLVGASADDDTPSSTAADKSTSHSGPRVVYPESTDELERITENIWASFGDYLRWVAPEREGGDFVETLKLIESLEVGGGAQSGASDADASVSDAGTAVTGASTATSTSVSTASSSGVGHASPPTILTLLSAHTLSILLRSAPPHSKDLTSLKAEGDRWWNETGKSVWESLKKRGAVSAPGLAGSGAESNGETMTNKAVYDLIAKKLFRVKHQAGLRVISFS